MKKTTIYIALIIEVIIAISIGVIGCADGQTKLLKNISTVLLIISFLLIILIFVKNDTSSKRILLDLLFSLVVVYINHAMLGLIFGWNECPLV